MINIITSLYLLSVVTISVISNMWPYVNLGGFDPLDPEQVNSTELNQYQLHMDDSMKYWVVINLVLVTVIGSQINICRTTLFVIFAGGFGNLLSLIALPYVRYRYKQQFSLLSNNIMVLILHLSATDLLYISIGVPHKTQVRQKHHYVVIYDSSKANFAPASELICLKFFYFRCIFLDLDQECVTG